MWAGVISGDAGQVAFSVEPTSRATSISRTGPQVHSSGTLLGCHVARAARAVLQLIFLQPASNGGIVCHFEGQAGKSVRRRHQVCAGRGIHEMGMMPHIEIFRIEKIDLEIRLAMVPCTRAGRRDGISG